MDATSFFSGDYVTARDRFRSAARAVDWTLSAYPIDAVGPGGEALTIDVAIAPAEGTDRTLVLSSGLHGVEGCLGSAVQLAVLDAWPRRPDAPVSMRRVLIHALNPYGFAWRRRVNENNVDLNRNFLQDGERFEGSPPLYAALDALLNPHAPPSPTEPAMLKFMLAIARYGMPALKEAIASGQYDFPQGLFYGGAVPEATHRLLAAHLHQWIAASGRVIHLDIHTGLGGWGSYKLLIDYLLRAEQRERLARCFGPQSFEVSDESKVAYGARGNLGRWCATRFRDRDYLYAAAEFGTYSSPRVLAGLRAENQAQHWAPADAACGERAKRALQELFCPRATQWRARALAEGLDLVDRAVNALAT